MRTIAACIFLLGLPVCMGQTSEEPSGIDLYVNNCAACHGLQGEGDGPVAAVMQVSVPNLRTLSQRSGGTFPREAVIAYVDGRDIPASHGSRQMPVWGNEFQWAEDEADAESAAERRIETIVDFVEELQYR